MNPNPYDRYEETKISTATPEALVLILYDGCIKFAGKAFAALESGDVQASHNALVRCQKIIEELDSSLEMSAGDIANNLKSLYEFVNERLIDSNRNKDPKPLEEALQVVRSMRAMWAEAMTQMAQTRKEDVKVNAAG